MEVLDPDGDNELEEINVQQQEQLQEVEETQIPAPLTEEEKKEVAIGSRKAHQVYRMGLLKLCNALVKDVENKKWKAMRSNSRGVMDEWFGDKRPEDKELRIIRVMAHLNVPIDRTINMFYDFDPATRPLWDKMVNGASIKTLEEFEGLSMKVVEWCTNFPSSWLGTSYNKRSVCLVSKGKNWCLQQELPACFSGSKHRNSGPLPLNHTDLNGDWSFIFLPNATQIVMLVGLNLPRGSDWLPYLSIQTTEDWVYEQLFLRLDVLEAVNKTYFTYYHSPPN